MTLRGDGLPGATWWSETEADWWAQRDIRPQEATAATGPRTGPSPRGEQDWEARAGSPGLTLHAQRLSKAKGRAGQGRAGPSHLPRRVPTTERLWPPRESQGTGQAPPC